MKIRKVQDLLITKEGVTLSIVFNRENKRNALNANMLQEFINCLNEVSLDDSIQVVILRGNGKCFSSGVDLKWLAYMIDSKNVSEVDLIMTTLHKLFHLPQTLIAIVHGSAHGGGAGMLACCDIVIAEENSSFSLGETKLGLIPAGIGPYVAHLLGLRCAKKLFLTGEMFCAKKAQDIGLIHEVVNFEQLDNCLFDYLQKINKTAPEARKLAKKYLIDTYYRTLDYKLIGEAAIQFKKVLLSAEAKKGILSFFTGADLIW